MGPELLPAQSGHIGVVVFTEAVGCRVQGFISLPRCCHGRSTAVSKGQSSDEAGGGGDRDLPAIEAQLQETLLLP